jgi:hypothetical protein
MALESSACSSQRTEIHRLQRSGRHVGDKRIFLSWRWFRCELYSLNYPAASFSPADTADCRSTKQPKPPLKICTTEKQIHPTLNLRVEINILHPLARPPSPLLALQMSTASGVRSNRRDNLLISSRRRRVSSNTVENTT